MNLCPFSPSCSFPPPQSSCSEHSPLTSVLLLVSHFHTYISQTSWCSHTVSKTCASDRLPRGSICPRASCCFAVSLFQCSLVYPGSTESTIMMSMVWLWSAPPDPNRGFNEVGYLPLVASEVAEAHDELLPGSENLCFLQPPHRTGAVKITALCCLISRATWILSCSYGHC